MGADTEYIKLDNIQKETWDGILAGGGGDSALPDVTAADNGKVLGVADGEWDVVTPESFAPFPISGTMSDDGGKRVITLDKTAEELYTTVLSGVRFQLTITTTIPTDETETTITTVLVTDVIASRVEIGETVIFSFRMIGYDGKQFAVDDLSESDEVVLTED